MRVPWMPKDTLAREAYDVISGYQDVLGHAVGPPIPVEDIIERYLGLRLGFVDLERELDMEDVLGATYVDSKLICIHEGLMVDRSLGRMSFTCAHEIGHWVLHRHLVVVAGRSTPIICRARNAKQPIEWQADYFAACLLMPEKDVVRAFHEVSGTGTLLLTNVKRSMVSSRIYVEPCVENWHLMAGLVCEAGGFTNVSKQAMVIRLQDLGLLINLTDASIGWGNAEKRQ